METLVGSMLAAILLFVAVFFGWRQLKTKAQLRDDADMPDDDRRYLAKQVRRRTLCSVLLAVFAGLLTVWLFLEPHFRELAPAEGEPVTEAAKDQVRFLTYYWIAALLLLLAILFLASWDFLATARFGLRRHRQLEQDRRAMLEMEAAQIRRRRQELN